MTRRRDQSPAGYLALLESDASDAEILKYFKEQYDNGDRAALLDAAAFCLDSGTAAPKWVRGKFTVAWLIKWKWGIARTLDEAFGISRPANWRQKRVRKDAFDGVLWREVIRLHREGGKPIGRDLFEQVAEEINQEASEGSEEGILSGLSFNGTDVQEAYYRHRLTKISLDSR
jgi:hypothetical protein